MHPAADALNCLITRPPIKLAVRPSISRASFELIQYPAFPSSPFVLSPVTVTSRLSVHVGHGTAIGHGPIAHPYLTLATYRRGLLVNSAAIEKRRSLQTCAAVLSHPHFHLLQASPS